MNLLKASIAAAPLAGALFLTTCSGGTNVQAPAPNPPSTTAPPNATPTPNATATATGKATATPGSPVTATPTPAATATPTAKAVSFTPDDWPLFDHDAARTGVSNEVTATHGVTALNTVWKTKLGDVADSAGVVKGSMLFVTVHNGTTYGIATGNGAIVWTFKTTGPNITTSEPAYDVTTNKLYAGGVDGRIHRLDPATGVEDTSNGFPVLVTLATNSEKNASPLNIANGYVYAQTSAYDGDGTPYVGHVVAIDTATGQSHVFNTLCASQKALIQPSTCSQQRSGMWSRSGPVVDPDSSMNGNVYVATGNGMFDTTQGDYGDAVLALARDMSAVAGAFAPSNYAMLEADDLDLGSSSPALLPRQTASNTPLLAVQAGKDGSLRLLNRAALGGANAALQTIMLPNGLFSAPAVYASPSGPTYVYVGLPNGVQAYTVTTTNGATKLVSAWNANVPLGGEGTSPVVRDGVVYVAATNELVALDAASGATLASNASLGSVHWESPVVSHGTVFCSDGSDNMTAFAIVTGGTAGQARRR